MTFDGFPRDTIRFLAGLSRNNDKKWFDGHRGEYEAGYIEPAKAFVGAIGPLLKSIDRDLQAVPRVNGSMMRINRDIRFSKDKSPYKNHLDFWFWSGEEKGWDSSGFFFRLTKDKLMLGAGMHGFMPPVLARYRAAVLDEKKGAALAKIVSRLRKAGHEVGGETYKKTPNGVPEDHPRAALTRHSGLHAGWEGKHPKELFGAKCLDFVTRKFAEVAAIHAWLKTM